MGQLGYVDYGTAALDNAGQGFNAMQFVMDNAGGGGGAPGAAAPNAAPTPEQITALANSDPSGSGLDQFAAQYRGAYDKALEAAARERDRASSPLNRVLSGVTGVISAPLKLMDNVFGGGTQITDVTAPFRPKEEATNRFDRQVMGLATQRAKFEQDYQASRAERSRALGQMTKNTAEIRQDTGNQIASLALIAQMGDSPEAKAQLWRKGLDTLRASNPAVDNMFPGMGDVAYTPQFGAYAISLGDKDVRKQFIDGANGTNVAITQGGTALNIPTFGGQEVRQMYQGGPIPTSRSAFGVESPAVQNAVAPTEQGGPTLAPNYEVPPAAAVPMGMPNGNSPTNARNDGQPSRTTNAVSMKNVGGQIYYQGPDGDWYDNAELR